MKVICLHDKNQIESFLRRNTFLNIYSIGDLDDYFWRFTTWYASAENAEIKAIAMVYSGLRQATLLALGDDEIPFLEELLRSIIRLLPKSFYSHLSLGLANILETQYKLESHGKHLKMALNDVSTLASVDTHEVVLLSRKDLGELESFYARVYPGHSFEASMLDTKQHYGIRGPNGLISTAGVHVYSKEYKVAALANIATNPDYRGKGYAKAVIAGLCKNLLPTVEHIGLNVKADNEPAIRCYKSLGFESIGSYEESVTELDIMKLTS